MPLARHLTGSEAQCGTVRGAGEDAVCVLLGPLCGPKPVSALLPDFLSSGKGSGRAGVVVSVVKCFANSAGLTCCSLYDS